MSVPSEKDLNREAGIIIEKIHAYIDQGKKVFATCSFYFASAFTSNCLTFFSASL